MQETGFDGYAIGGLAVGEGHAAMCEVLDYAPAQLPADKPRYLMGVGKPVDLVEATARGVDMFDCVLPTRSGRHGQAWTWNGPVNLKNARFAEDDSPLDPESDCPASRDYSRAYLHHLVRSGEILGQVLFELAQHRPFPGAHRRHARRDRGGPVRELPTRFPRAAGALRAVSGRARPRRRRPSPRRRPGS